jgi:hypothetical protein
VSQSAATESSAARRKARIAAVSGINAASARIALPPPIAEPVAAPKGKSRDQLKGVVIYINPVAKKRLSQLARKYEKTVQDIGIEAINLMFRHYGEKPLA